MHSLTSAHMLVHHVSYRYPDSATQGVSDLSFVLAAGERMCVVGPNGAGKSTLAGLVLGELKPSEGTLSCSGRIGFVAQDAVTQLLCSRVEDELAYGPQNLGLSQAEVERRVTQALSEFDIEPLAARMTSQLSGGEQQLVVLAATLAMHPQIVVLDEICAQLDSTYRQRVREAVAQLADKGVGVLEISHHVSDVFGADRVLLLESGRATWEGSPDELLASPDLLARSGLALEGYERLVPLLSAHGCPSSSWASVEQLGAFVRSQGLQQAFLDRVAPLRTGGLAGMAPAGPVSADLSSAGLASAGQPVLVATELSVSYGEGRDAFRALSKLNLTLRAGELTLVAGRSGSGKSTFARALTATLPPQASFCTGSVTLCGQPAGFAAAICTPVAPGAVAFAQQRPQDQLFASTVYEDVSFGPQNQGLPSAQVAELTQHALKAVSFPQHLTGNNPLELSGGQQRLAAHAGIAALNTQAYVFDEPTAALDNHARQQFKSYLSELLRNGAAVCVISHDLPEWLDVAHKLLILSHGTCVWYGTPHDLLHTTDPLVRAHLVPPAWLSVAHELAHPADTCREPANTSGPADKSCEPAASSTGQLQSPSFLQRRSASAKLCVWAVLLVVVCIASWKGIAAAYILLGMELIAARISPAQVLRTAKPLAFIVVASLCINGLVVDGSGTWSVLGPVGLSAPGALRALVALARVFVLFGFSLVVAQTTDIPDLCQALLAPLRPLGRWGLPVQDFAQMLSIAVRFAPICVEEFDRIRAAQLVRGASFGRGSLAERLRAYVSVLVPVLSALIGRSDDLARALRARGYGLQPPSHRTAAPAGLRASSWSAGDWLLFVLGCISCGIILYM